MAKRDKSLNAGVRLRMGGSKARPVLLTHEIDRLLAELERHRVKIDPVPKELNSAWIGRK
jgi:hypothetical protein